MRGSIAAELLVLRKRISTWILLGIWIVLALAFSYLLPYLTYRNSLGTAAPQPLAAAARRLFSLSRCARRETTA